VAMGVALGLEEESEAGGMQYSHSCSFCNHSPENFHSRTGLRNSRSMEGTRYSECNRSRRPGRRKDVSSGTLRTLNGHQTHQLLPQKAIPRPRMLAGQSLE
jgi:hypothetical protein